MAIPPIDTKTFKKWLISKGLVQIRTTASHEVWDYPPESSNKLLRPIIIRGHIKDIPGFHINSNLKTLNVKYKDFLKQIGK
jgi:hypothetical protein